MKLKKLTNITADDLNDLYKEVNQDVCLVSLPIPLEESKASAYVEAIEKGRVGERELLSYGIYEENELIGKIEVTKIDEVAELDLVIKEKYENFGFGKGALKEFLSIINEINYCEKIEAFVRSDNTKMIKVLEANFFNRGREFKADIMKEHEGIYQLMTVNGYEYFIEFKKVL